MRRALLSVSDKRGIVDFGRGLAELGIELVSTGGTAVALRLGGLEVRTIEDFTGFPEMMDGRVKTLHPRLYAGLLCLRDNPEHLRAAAEQGIEFVDLVCVNLYPFERTSARRGVTDATSVETACARTAAELGPVDVLVNNAGIAESAPFGKTTVESWERHLRVNVTGPYLMTRALLGGMLERGWGRVINVASLAGLYGSPYVTAYTTSKHALVGFTRALATEVSGKGVTVNAICPGFAATDMVWNSARNIAARTGRSFEDAVASLARMNPGGRLIEPEEIADEVRRLVGDDTINGEAVVLDGSTPQRRMA